MSEQAKLTPPALCQLWPEQGGVFVGSRLIIGVVHHILIADGGASRDVTEVNGDTALSLDFGKIGGFRGWHAGDQEDHMLAYTNARGHFWQEINRGSVYWTRSTHRGVRWAFSYLDGGCAPMGSYVPLRARAFRHVCAQPSRPSHKA